MHTLVIAGSALFACPAAPGQGLEVVVVAATAAVMEDLALFALGVKVVPLVAGAAGADHASLRAYCASIDVVQYSTVRANNA